MPPCASAAALAIASMLCKFGDVGGKGRGALSQFLGRRLGFGEMARNDQNLAARLGERRGDALADALARPVTTTDLPASDVNIVSLLSVHSLRR